MLVGFRVCVTRVSAVSLGVRPRVPVSDSVVLPVCAGVSVCVFVPVCWCMSVCWCMPVCDAACACGPVGWFGLVWG